MSSSGQDKKGRGIEEALLPPPPTIPPNVVPVRDKTKQVLELAKKENARLPMARCGHGTKGQKTQLLTNHFKVKVSNPEVYFFHYSVAIFYEDGHPVDGMDVGHKVLDQVHKIYHNELARKNFAYDGKNNLFTIGALPQNKLNFTVVLEDVRSDRNKRNGSSDPTTESDRKRVRRPYRSKTFKVEIRFAARIPMEAIASALRDQETEYSQESLRVLDIILRQHASKQSCLLVRQSFFHNDPKNFRDLNVGVLSCSGFHSSFRTSQDGLSLNLDVSTTTIIKPGPVMKFLLANQGVSNQNAIDWTKAKRVLRNLRIQVSPSNAEFKITGLSEKPCREQTFILKKRKGDAFEETEVTVYDYFVNHHTLTLRDSGKLPCINVGKPKRPTFFPIELCYLVPLQRYTKALSTSTRALLVSTSRQKPQERMNVLSNALKQNNYDAEPMLRSCGISISNKFTQVEGRVLPPPRLKLGNEEHFGPQRGRWNYNRREVVDPIRIVKWAVANFSAECNIDGIVNSLIKRGGQMGILIKNPSDVIDEPHRFSRDPPSVRVDKMYKELQSRLPGEPEFLLCLIPTKNSDIYGSWKKKVLVEEGIVTQCLVPPKKISDQYVTNVLLKINAKLGGLNSMLVVGNSLPMVYKKPTIIIGMDVSHGSPGQSDIPSIAAVVSSREWPSISRYRASTRTQSPKVEMIDSLYKKVADKDEGIMRELLLDFYKSSGHKPKHIIIFRDGVSESQFIQVLNIELDQIIQSCKHLDSNWDPKFVVIVAQKRHHTKFFVPGSPDNVQPGTVIDNGICHPRNNDFYLCAHAGMIGTTRPTHYHVLLDEVGFSADDLQELVHSLSYVYQRSTTAISVVAPIYYAHLAASQMGQVMKFEETSNTSSSHGGLTSDGSVPVPQLPILNKKVQKSMFFC